MSDITPKSVASSPGATPALAASATPATSNTATAAEIPAAVANMSIGTVVTGTVVDRSPRGLVVLRTDKGTIKLQSSVALKQGSTVTLQIQSVGTQVQLQILSIDGQPLATTPTKQSSTRLDSAAKLPVNEAPAGRPPASSAKATNLPPSTAKELDMSPVRATPSDRVATDRTAPTRGQPVQTTAPAGGFVARPLAQINSVSLEALSSPPSIGPGMANPLVRPSTALTPDAAGLPTPGQKTPGATLPASTGTSTAPVNIAIGERFTASIVSPSAILPGGNAEDGDPIIARAPSSPPLPLPPTGTAATAATPPPPALASDRVILRLLGMAATPNDAAALGVTASQPPPSPGIATGLTAAADARTMVGTIIEGGADSRDVGLSHPSLGSATTAKTLIATPLGLLAAAGPPPGPVGSKLLLELIAPGATSDPRQFLAGSSSLPTTFLNPADKSWPALRSLMSAIQAVAPGAAEQLSNVTLPQIGPNLAAGIMVFVAALRQGNPRAWLGEQTVDILQRSGHGALVDKLGDEMTSVTRQAAETSPQGWQTLLVPLHDGVQLQQIRMYWKRQQRKPNQNKDGTRFVIEADLTTLGTLQLDGVFNKPQFDLVVRTSSSLPAPIRGDIIEIFGDALLATSLKGAVSFLTTRDLRAGPPDNDAEPGTGLIV